MKSVILFRHGKSDWNASYGIDHDRPLNSRGIKAAKKMGQYLLEKDQVPDLIISSTAVRAKTTAQLAIESANWQSKLMFENNSVANKSLNAVFKYSSLISLFL